MNKILCRKEITLTDVEKRIFSEHLKQLELSGNIWDLFGEWVARSTPAVSFFYLKVYRDDELIGLGLFLKVKPVDLRSSYSGLRRNVLLKKLAGGLSMLGNNCLYISFRNLITSNITRPFFYKEPALADAVMTAILTYLKNEREADMVTIIDTLTHDDLFRREGFAAYPSSSEAYFDALRYRDISEYLAGHRNLKKHLAKSKITCLADVQQGPVSEEDKRQMNACMSSSVENSNVNNPCQKFFEENIFGTEVFDSDKYLHIVVRVEGVIAGFHTFQISGADMGGVLGGFNRDYTRNNYLYERVIAASLDYAIQNNLKRIHYSLIDNQTKLRLVDCLEPCALYFYSRKALNRKVFAMTYRFNDIFKVHMLERSSPTGMQVRRSDEG